MKTLLVSTAAATALLLAPAAQALDLSFTTCGGIVPSEGVTRCPAETGTDGQAGATYRFDDIAPGIDGILSIDSLNNSVDLTSTDGIVIGGAFGGDDIIIELQGWGDDDAVTPGETPSWAGFTLTFVQSDTSNPVQVDVLEMISYDIDSSNSNALDEDNFSDTLWIPNGVPSSLPGTTNLEIEAGAGDFAGFQQVTLQQIFQNQINQNPARDDSDCFDDDECQQKNTVNFSYADVSSITWRWGLTGPFDPNEDSNGAGRAMLLSGNAIFVPEPGTALLMSIAGLSVALGARRNGRRR